MEQIINVLPGIGRAKVAFQRISDLSVRFANPEAYLNLVPGSSVILFNEGIELRGIRYAFNAPEDGEAFVLVPIDLALKPGELVFVVGDNVPARRR